MAKVKTKNVRLSEKVHMKAKLRATRLGIQLSDYVEALIEENLDKFTAKSAAEKLSTEG